MKDILIDFGIPVFILAILAGMIFSGIDGEVKSLFAATVGYLTHSSIKRTQTKGSSP